MQQQKIPVLAVVGPTASGKSKLAVELAKHLNGEVISADSMQIYKDMLIGTARPTPEEMEGIPHHLVGFADAEHPFSVAEYVQLAADCIQDITLRGKLPILAGGTGLYVRSLLANIQFSQEEHDDTLREALMARAQEEGGESLLEELRKIDPETAARLHPNNLGRIVRAIELYRVTGITMTEQLKRSKQTPSPYRSFLIGLDFEERSRLYARINQRVDEMMQKGLEEEARHFLSMHSRTAAQAIGYKELRPYFEGQCSREQAVERMKQETRHYAKRQLTWFRREEAIYWIKVDKYPKFEQVVQEALKLAQNFLAHKGDTVRD